LYQRLGVDLGPVQLANRGSRRVTSSGARSCLRRRWRFGGTAGRGGLPDPVIALASGWMRIKQRAKANAASNYR